MLKTTPSTSSYVDQPCERCGSKKHISKTWKEVLQNSLGTSMIEVSQITCTNKACQALFDANRVKELVTINERKSKKEEQDQIRKKNIANTISERKNLKAAAASKSKK
jgi:hypothetical protein